MEQIKNIVEKIVEGVLEEKKELFLIDVIYKGSPGSYKLVIILDGDNGLSIDNCAYVSRKVANVIEEEDLIADKYTLEVTSAGLEHPLKIPRQYQKNVGRNVKVLLNDGGENNGVLKGISDDVIQIEVKKDKKGKEVELKDIPLSSIKKTNVLVSFK